MKKQLLILALIILYIGVKAQVKPFIGLSFHNKGYSLQGGGKYKDWVGLVGCSKPLTSAINPTLFFSNVGYEISLPEGFNITPLMGISSFTYLDKQLQVNGVTWMSGLEIGKNFNDGRLFITGTYCEGFMFGAGMKIFMN